jgi:acyl-homoserine lactone acylase PvdQ
MKASWTRDEQEIPQIVADDLFGIHWGMGYCHAMDRGSTTKARKPPGSGAVS